MSNNKANVDKKSELIRKISELADGVTLEYVKELSETISDPEADTKDKQKAFREMDKVLRIAKQYSDRVLLAEGKATENIGVGGMNKPFEVTITKTYEVAKMPDEPSSSSKQDENE